MNSLDASNIQNKLHTADRHLGDMQMHICNKMH